MGNDVISKIEKMIYVIRGLKVMLDGDLANLYEVEVKQLNRAVLRNRARFPSDFMFQLNFNELEDLRCQIGTANLPTLRNYKRRNRRNHRPEITTQ